jgi:hypothetical protein
MGINRRDILWFCVIFMVLSLAIPICLLWAGHPISNLSISVAAGIFSVLAVVFHEACRKTRRDEFD